MDINKCSEEDFKGIRNLGSITIDKVLEMRKKGRVTLDDLYKLKSDVDWEAQFIDSPVVEEISRQEYDQMKASLETFSKDRVSFKSEMESQTANLEKQKREFYHEMRAANDSLYKSQQQLDADRREWENTREKGVYPREDSRYSLSGDTSIRESSSAWRDNIDNPKDRSECSKGAYPKERSEYSLSGDTSMKEIISSLRDVTNNPKDRSEFSKSAYDATKESDLSLKGHKAEGHYDKEASIYERYRSDSRGYQTDSRGYEIESREDQGNGKDRW